MMFSRFAAIALMAMLSVLLSFGNVAQAQTCGTHTVLPGENLFRISLRYGVSLSALAAANNISNVRLIFPGQVLTIPCGGAQPGQPVNQPPPTGGSGGLDCTGFRATSPVDGLPHADIPFYWDPPVSGDQIARYQLHIFNENGFEVAVQEILNYGRTFIVQNTSIGYIGPGQQFFWYVVGVTADNRICQTQTVWLPREWPIFPDGSSPPPATPDPSATEEVLE